MAPPVYSTRFFAAADLAAGPYPFVIPGGYRGIVRDIDVAYKTPSGAGTLYVSGPSGAIFFYISVDPTINGRWQPWRGRQIFEELEEVNVNIGSGQWDISISGYLLTLP